MHQQLSPKKYIQTRARTLPIYKCYVNKDWVENNMANVFVMRRHVNGHLTVGVYLVDLLCLGIKDTFFMFNEDEDEVMDQVDPRLFMEIGYLLAHNIVFAGHDFAMDFDIHPVKEFSITRFILEEDTDAIPLIEIQTGDLTGKPHLMVDTLGQYSDALAKLKKHAGEGGYHYTVRMGFGEDDFDRTLEDDGEPGSIDDYEEDTITPLDAMYISAADLLDEEKVESRSPSERISLYLEGLLRALRISKSDLIGFDAVTELPEYDRHLAEETADVLNGSEPEDSSLALEQTVIVRERIAEELLPLMEHAGEPLAEKALQLLADFDGNVLAATAVFELLIVGEGNVQNEVIRRMEHYALQYPYVRLLLALSHLNHPNKVPGDYSLIYKSSDISDVFPNYSVFHAEELFMYWLIKMVLAIRAADIPGAIRFYALVAQTEIFSLQLMSAQMDLYKLIRQIVVPDEELEDQAWA